MDRKERRAEETARRAQGVVDVIFVETANASEQKHNREAYGGCGP